MDETNGMTLDEYCKLSNKLADKYPVPLNPKRMTEAERILLAFKDGIVDLETAIHYIEWMCD